MPEKEQLQHERSWSEGLMRVFLETAVDAIIVIDSVGRIESFNPAAERMFGYRDLDVVGTNVKKLMPSPFTEEHDGYIANFLRTGEKRIIGSGREVQARRKDGTVFPIHLSVAELEIDGDRHFTGIIRDLSAEKESRDREAAIARILDASLNEIFVFDAETMRFIQVNRGGRANLGYSMEELFELTPVEIKPDFTEASFNALVKPLRTGERERLVFTTNHLRKDGSLYPVEVHLQLSEFAGRPAFVAIILDTTERDELQKQLLHSQKLEAIGQLAGALAHDFNNLLMGVMSGCRMVARRVESDEMSRNMLDEIQKEAHKGAGITRQLLDFSRKSSYQTGPCDLASIVHGAENLFRSLLGEGIELRVRSDASDCTIVADSAKLDQILMNLVVNARDAMPAGGSIDIDVSRIEVVSPKPGLAVGTYVGLTVADSGHGIESAIQSRVFEPFFTTKEMGKGTGLGLATVFGLTQEFGGHIELESAPGKGATFRLYFPLSEGGAPSLDEGAEDSQRGTETILLVEDSALVRAGIRHLLQSLGYAVLDAPHAERALELLVEAPRVDLLLTDIVMPGMNGPELAEHARAEQPALPVLFMSGFSDRALIEQGRLQSGTSILEKPFEEEELARMIREQLARD